jgi:hypothetical protein
VVPEPVEVNPGENTHDPLPSQPVAMEMGVMELLSNPRSILISTPWNQLLFTCVNESTVKQNVKVSPVCQVVLPDEELTVSVSDNEPVVCAQAAVTAKEKQIMSRMVRIPLI